MWRIYKRLEEERQRKSQLEEEVLVDDMSITALEEEDNEPVDAVLENPLETSKEIVIDNITASLEQDDNEPVDAVLENPLEAFEETDFFDENLESLKPNQFTEQKELSAQELLEERLKIIGDIVNKSKIKNPVDDENTAEDEDLSKFDFQNFGEEVTEDYSNSIVVDDSKDAVLEEETKNEINESVLEEEQDVEDDVNFTDEVFSDQMKEEASSDATSVVEKNTNQELVTNMSRNSFINVAYVDELFSFLKKEYKEAFIAGVVYENRTDSVICNFNVTDNQVEFFRMLTTELTSAVSRSNFNRIDTGYMLDLQDGEALVVLTFTIHQMVVVFDQNIIDIGYLQSVVKPYVVAEYNKALNSRADYSI